MAVQVSYPGVYIDEFAPGAPIQGVSTNIAALVGISAQGPLDTPTRVTSWDQFRRVFGDEPRPGFHLWFAVRGFFENGGTVCYVVRASNGSYGNVVLNDRAGNGAVRVRPRQPGVTGIKISVAQQHLLTTANTTVYQPAGVLAAQAGRDITLVANQSWQFRPGDEITIAAAGERRRVVRVAGNIVRVAEPFANAYAAASAVRLANAATGTRTLRIRSTVAIPAGALTAGTLLTIKQGATTVAGVVDSVQAEYLYDAANVLTLTQRVTLRAGISAALTLDGVTAATVQSEEFRFRVTLGGDTDYDNLAMDSAHPRYFVRVINEDAGGLVQVDRIEPPPMALPPSNVLADVAAAGPLDGTAENLAGLADIDFTDALDTLEPIDEISLVAIPDRRTPAVQAALIAHCERLMDRFAILDSQYTFSNAQHTDVENQRQASTSTRGYAALYYPWLRVPPPGSGDPVIVPPSGHVCGVIARSDAFKGVHKAPANEIVNGSVGVERRMNKTDQGLLNLAGINVIEQSGVGRPLLMGARTTASDRNWLHVSTRRLFLFLEESIQEGIGWAVFEPNNLQLWQKLKRSISDFLSGEWRNGALFGKSAEEAFYVRIDETLNPFSAQQLGYLHIEIGLRPTYPAEFIIVRIGIWAGGGEVSEA
ncbi:MAG: phage tail sheath subtilisin-like domain-containing protein [Rhodanobacteraceae bacterium]|nr:phage tail sheath subtilisin-like domain-containing protein [Rhodanobacteraceae bacterium]